MSVSEALGYRARLDQAIELREDGDLAESVEMFAAVFAEGGADADAALEYAKTLRKMERFAEADRVLCDAIEVAPENFELRRAWAEIPRHEVNYASTIARGRVLRRMFPPERHEGAWESLLVELDCFYEMGDWDALAQAVREHWEVFLTQPPMLPHGIGALNKLFWGAELGRLAREASPGAWAHLPDHARENLLTKSEIAMQNLAAIESTGIRVISIGQNCLPYQLAGRWGLVARQADPSMLTPFDLGGFINDSAADAIETDFAAFETREDFAVTKAWGGGKMFIHQPSGVGFFHERGSHWVTPDRGRFFARLAMMTANWDLAKRQAPRLFVFCYCGNGELAKLVRVAAAKLLAQDAHLLVIDVLRQPHDCPALENVTYRHIPYPRDYDWTSVYQQCSDAGLAMERAMAEAIGWCIVKLNPAARAMLPYLREPAAPTPAMALTRGDLVSSNWRLTNRNGHVLGERFGFGETGMIEDYQNENESSWRLEDGVLKIFKRNGDLMWISTAADLDARAGRQIQLGTHLNPALDLYLTETGPKAAAAPVRRYSGALRVLLLSNGLDIERRLGGALARAEIFRINREDEIDKFPDCNVFVSGLVMSHARRPDEAAAFAARVTKRFALAIFFELSAHEAEYLRGFGLESFHRGFAENAGTDALSLDFVAGAVASSGVYKVEHFADAPAFDSFKDWVVSGKHQKGTVPSVASRGDYRVFERPVFEMSVYACHRFEALDVPLQDQLTLVEMRLLRFRAESSGFRLNHGAPPGEVGRLLYNTFRDAPAALRDRPISSPLLVDDGPPPRSPQQQAALEKWRSEFKIEIAELSVYEFENCVVAGTGTVFCEGKFVRGTDYLLMFLNSSSLDPIMRGLQQRHPAQHLDGVAIVGFNALYDNYYHFVAEAMATISLCLDLLEDRHLPRITIITGKLNKFRRDYLDVLLQGDPRYRIVELERSEFITADTLIYGDNVGRTVHQQVCWEEVPFANKIIAGYGLQACQASRKIYVARTDTKGRAMSNEAEMIEILAAMGFEIFAGSQHSVAEQVRTFREARFIVAPHGAGLTNVLYCQPGTVLVEWQQSGYFNTGMMRLAQLGNLKYYSQMFFPAGEGHSRDDWAIDIGRAVKLVEHLQQIHLADHH